MVLALPQNLILPKTCFTSDVVGLAQVIHRDRKFDRMPVLADALMDAGYEDEEVIDHLRSDIYHCQTCPVLVAILGKKIVPKNSCTYLVDYDQRLRKLIKANKYGWVSPYINSRSFPNQAYEVGKKEQQFKLYRFDHATESDFVTAEMKKDKMRPATLRELLAYGKANPELQREFHIIALGSICLDTASPYVCGLCGHITARRLFCYSDFHGWEAGFRFLAVNK